MRTLCAAAVLVATAAGMSPAQDVPVQRLQRADAAFPEPFSTVSGLRELSDGRLVISDRLEQSASLVDLGSGDLIPIGRQGQGPGEYGIPAGLFALPGDSTMLIDFGNFRGLIITPDGQVGESISFRLPGEMLVIPRAVDGQGRLYAESSIALGAGPRADGGGSEGTPIVRWDHRNGLLDTVAMLPPAAGGSGGVTVLRGGGGSFRTTGPGLRPYAPQNAWDIAQDGRVAIAHAAEYHVEWTGPGGAPVSGPAVSYEPVEIGRAEKQAWAARVGGMVMTMQTSQGTRTIRPQQPDIDDQEWPEHLPPFDPRSAHVTPEGKLWLKVSTPAGEHPARFDVFDRRGRRVRTVELPIGRRLVGFGRGTVYTVHRDEDDLEWLERFRR